MAQQMGEEKGGGAGHGSAAHPEKDEPCGSSFLDNFGCAFDERSFSGFSSGK
jgi:hypothetical protein